MCSSDLVLLGRNVRTELRSGRAFVRHATSAFRGHPDGAGIIRVEDRPIPGIQGRPTGRGSDLSGAAETDRHLAGVEDHGYVAASGKLDHPGELFGVGLDVDVADRVLALRVILTGRGRVGSGVLSEDLHALLFHPFLRFADDIGRFRPGRRESELFCFDRCAFAAPRSLSRSS